MKFCLLVLCALTLRAQPNIGGVVNDYASVVSIRTSKNELTVTNPSAFAQGNAVILMQMQGASIDTVLGPTYGRLRSYNNSGRFERNVISRVIGNVITLRNRLSQAYTVGNGLQIVRMPTFGSARVTTVLTCPPWNGATGGVVAIDVTDTLYLDVSVDVSGCGFRGGWAGADSLFSASGGMSPRDWASNDSCCASERGEGIATSPYTRGAAPTANGGGGGAMEVHGGGGGAHAGCGGDGADVVMWSGNRAFGRAALPLSYATGYNRLFMGGGGGAGPRRGAADKDTAFGGRGGGIMILDVPVIIGANGAGLMSNGGDGRGSRAAGGGGGAGGAIMSTATTIINVPQLQCTGGRGGTPILSGLRLCTGPGGGGGGGVILLGTLNPLNLNPSAYTGGNGGQQLADTCKTVQGKQACSGTVLYNTVINEDTVAFRQPLLVVRTDTTVCAGATVMLRGKSTVPVSWWQGGTLLCDSCDSIEVKVDATTTYIAVATYADRTSDSATVRVTIFLTPPITITPPPPICPGDSATIAAPPTFVRYAWSTGDTTSTIIVRLPAVYTVTVIDSNGCATTASATLRYQSLNVVTVDSIASGATNAIDVPAAYVLERSCVGVDVRSIADTNVIIHRATMQRGVELSVPISQFPLILPPRSTATIQVCAMSELPGDFADTVHLQSGCGVYDVPIATHTWETPAFTRCRVRVTGPGEQELFLPPQIVMDAYSIDRNVLWSGTLVWTLLSVQGAVVDRGQRDATASSSIQFSNTARGTYIVALQWEGGRAAGLVLMP